MSQSPKKRAPFQSLLEKRPEYVQAIGMISVEQANLELMLGDLLAEVLGVDPRMGETLYLTPKSAMARIEIFENVVTLTFSPVPVFDDMSPEIKNLHEEVNLRRRRDQRRIEALLRRTKAIVGKRHKIIHDAWGIKQATLEVARHSLPIKPKSLPTVVPVSVLTDLIRDLRATIDNVYDLTLELARRRADQAYARAQALDKIRGQTRGSPPVSKRSPIARPPKKKRPPRSSRV